MNHSILIVEDEPSIVTLLKYNLEQQGFQTEIAYNGEDALQYFEENTYDLIVLDLMLPKMDGTTVCKSIRQTDPQIPIIMLTAKDTEYDKIHGLEMGADDYLTKPFSPKELIARMNAILRRTNEKAIYDKPKIQVGELIIYPQKFEAYFKNNLLELTRKQFELLVYLTQHQGDILSREQLLNAVWGFDFVGDSRIVDVQVSHLREKIEEDTKNPDYIKTMRGFGYKMEALE